MLDGFTILFGIVCAVLGAVFQANRETNATLKGIMKTQQEITEALKAQTELLVTIGDDVGTAIGEVAKIGTETDTLNQKITDLTNAIANGGPASPELEAAVDAVAAQIAVVRQRVTTAKAALQAVDDKVPDAPSGTGGAA